MEKIVIFGLLVLLIIPFIPFVHSFVPPSIPHSIMIENVRVMDKKMFNLVKVDVVFTIPNADPNGQYRFPADTLVLQDDDDHSYHPNNNLGFQKEDVVYDSECRESINKPKIEPNNGGSGTYTYCYSVTKGYNHFTLYKAPVAPDKEWLVIDQFAFDSNLKRVNPDNTSNLVSGTVITHAFNPNGNLNSHASCTSLVGGIWNGDSKTCTIAENARMIKIEYKQTLVIDPGYTLVISNSGYGSTGIYLSSYPSGKISGQIINKGTIIISNSGEVSKGIEIARPSLITNDGTIIIENRGDYSSGVFVSEYVGCDHFTTTDYCSTSLTNNGTIIISNTGTSSKGLVGGKIIDNGIIRLMDKADYEKEFAQKKSLEDKKSFETKKQQIVDGLPLGTKSNATDFFSQIRDKITSIFNILFS